VTRRKDLRTTALQTQERH